MLTFCLEHESPGLKGNAVIIPNQMFVVGKGSKAHLRFPPQSGIGEAEIVLLNTGMSVHAQNLTGSGRVKINGEEFLSDLIVLCHGDQIEIEGITLKLEIDIRWLKDVQNRVLFQRVQCAYVGFDASGNGPSRCKAKGHIPRNFDFGVDSWLCQSCIAKYIRARPSILPKRCGSFEILIEIARGGMGVVYKGAHIATGVLAAVKMIQPQPNSADNDFIERFIHREQPIMQLLHHPNIVRVIEVGTSDAFSNHHYVALEHMSGRSAAEYFSVERDFKEVIRAGIDMFSALDYMHRVGFIHRDIKPDNLLLIRSDVDGKFIKAKIADFGLAKYQADNWGNSNWKTKTGRGYGHPLFMAPENVEDGFARVGESVDMYAAAATLYWMLSGYSPLGDRVHQYKLPANRGEIKEEFKRVRFGYRKPLEEACSDRPNYQKALKANGAGLATLIDVLVGTAIDARTPWRAMHMLSLLVEAIETPGT